MVNPRGSGWRSSVDVPDACRETSSCSDSNHGLREYLVANYSVLHRRLSRQLGCPDLASESLHEAWIRLGERRALQEAQSPEAYVYRVTCNVAMDRLRANRSWQYTGDADTGLEQMADGAPGPDTIAEARSDLAAVERAMNLLPRRELAVLTALRIDELTRQEVATRHGVSLRRVDTALRRALQLCAQAGRETVSHSA